MPQVRSEAISLENEISNEDCYVSYTIGVNLEKDDPTPYRFEYDEEVKWLSEKDISELIHTLQRAKKCRKVKLP